MAGDDEEDPPYEPTDPRFRELLGMAARPPPVRLREGQILDDVYRIVAEIGAGGMGRVYRARDLRLRRDIAIKVLDAGAPTDEAGALAKLVHPNVVTVHRIGSWAGRPWIAMEYVAGGTARTWLSAAPRTQREIVELYLAAARGLSAAHEVGLVHGDFKPDNVLVGSDGRARVADFGLAREVMSEPGAVAGTPSYMAPEQWGGQPVGPAADQFAFAVSLWEALAGRRPFAIASIDDGPRALHVAPARVLAPALDRPLRRALAYAPADRWPSLAALAAALAAPRRRSRLVAGGVAAVVVAGVATGGVVWSRTRGGCVEEPGPTDDGVTALVAAHAGTAIDGAPARVDRLAGEQQRAHVEQVAVACAGDRESPAANAGRACRARAVAATRALYEAATALHPSRVVPVLLDAPSIDACADARDPTAASADTEVADAALRFVEDGEVAAASAALARAVPGAPRTALAHAALAIRMSSPDAKARLDSARSLAVTDDDALIAERLAIARAAALRDRDTTRRAVAAALAQVEPRQAQAPREAYRVYATAAAAIVEDDPQRALQLLASGARPPSARARDRAEVTRLRALIALGDAAGAGELAASLSARLESALGPRHSEVALVRVLSAQLDARPEVADRLRAEALARFDATADDSIASIEIGMELAAHQLASGVIEDRRVARARAGLARNFGERHLEVARLDAAHGHALLLRGDHANVADIMRRVLDVALPVVGAAHALVFAARLDLSLALVELGALDQALAEAQRAAAIAHDRGSRARAILHLGSLHNLRREWQQAYDVLGPLLPEYRRVGSRDDIDTSARLHHQSGLALLELGRTSEALIALRNARDATVWGGLPQRTAEIAALLARAVSAHERAGR